MSSSLDDELAQALRESESVAQAQPAPVAVPVARSTKKPKRNIALLVALLVMGAGILSLVFTSFKGSLSYSRKVDELLSERDRFVGRNVTVQGKLKRGTLVRRDEPCEYRFTVLGDKQELPMRIARCVLPDTFKDVPGMDTLVTAQGTLVADGYFEASNVMAQCPSRYDMKNKASKGEQAPHGMMGPTSSL